MLMNDRVVLVTGASRGIGAATAKVLAAHGAAVAVNYHSSEASVAGVVLAMACDATGFVSGAYVPVSGGTLMP